jgi:hypothetical protein
MEMLNSNERDPQKTINTEIQNNNDLLSVSGYYQAFRLDPRIKEYLKDELIKHFQDKCNDRFNNTLSWFQKNIHTPKGKQLQHARKVTRNSKLINIGFELSYHLIPLGISFYLNNVRKKELKEFIIGWTAYINRENTPAIQNRLEHFMDKHNINYNYEEYNILFTKYSNKSSDPGILVYPMRRNIDSDAFYSLANFVISCCNVKDLEIKKRVDELCSYLGLSEEEGDEIKANQTANIDFLSTYLTLQGISFYSIATNVFEDVQNAENLCMYNLENDFQRTERERIQNIVKRVSSGAITLGAAALTYALPAAGDAALVLLAPFVYKFFNETGSDNKMLDPQQVNEAVKCIEVIHREFNNAARKKQEKETSAEQERLANTSNNTNNNNSINSRADKQ